MLLITNLVDTDPVPRGGLQITGDSVPARNRGVWRIWWRNIVENYLRIWRGLHHNGNRLFLRFVVHLCIYGGQNGHLNSPKEFSKNSSPFNSHLFE